MRLTQEINQRMKISEADRSRCVAALPWGAEEEALLGHWVGVQEHGTPPQTVGSKPISSYPVGRAGCVAPRRRFVLSCGPLGVCRKYSTLPFTSLLHRVPTLPFASVFKQQATARVCALGRRLREQEDDFTGRAATFQQEIQHLQVQLRDRQEQLYGALQQKRPKIANKLLEIWSVPQRLVSSSGDRTEEDYSSLTDSSPQSYASVAQLREVENELEVMWEATTRESRHLQSMVTGSRRVGRSLSRDAVTPALAPGSSLSPAWKLCVQDSLHQVGQPASRAPPAFCSKQNSFPLPLQRSPMFESDSDQHQNPSSDESEKNGLDFYS
ncbi:hypothetical protein P4O66_021848 [Electrophorus voltai]|uniref:Uncharacterized protein n=1 Tax=Electrophorus voltai TaxID=2609070 RepID=A0AAD9E2Q5_9TELE|nr:hypothetical protein P4O66_021848 [Electrophorus voltai]